MLHRKTVPIITDTCMNFEFFVSHLDDIGKNRVNQIWIICTTHVIERNGREMWYITPTVYGHIRRKELFQLIDVQIYMITLIYNEFHHVK